MPKGITAIPGGRELCNCRFSDWHLSVSIRASVMPIMEIWAAPSSSVYVPALSFARSWKAPLTFKVATRMLQSGTDDGQ